MKYSPHFMLHDFYSDDFCSTDACVCMCMHITYNQWPLQQRGAPREVRQTLQKQVTRKFTIPSHGHVSWGSSPLPHSTPQICPNLELIHPWVKKKDFLPIVSCLCLLLRQALTCCPCVHKNTRFRVALNMLYTRFSSLVSVTGEPQNAAFSPAPHMQPCGILTHASCGPMTKGQGVPVCKHASCWTSFHRLDFAGGKSPWLRGCFSDKIPR